MPRLVETLTNLDIVLGDACNLRCVHCPHWMNDSSPRFAAEVLRARLEEAVGYVARHCPGFEKVMLIGGEPFVHPGAVSFLQQQRIDTLISVYTNFVWPDPEVELPTNVYFLSSMDAASQQLYGQIRRTNDFAAGQANMRARANQLWHVDTTVSKANLGYLAEILAVTEDYDCSHWFLPIDPRMIRYATLVNDASRPGTAGERRNSAIAARVVGDILLDDEDLERVRLFFQKNRSARTNDFDTFAGIYLSGIDNYKRDSFEYRSDLQVAKPVVPEQRCAGIRRYMEVGFTADGLFQPMIHCPELWDIMGADRGPGLATFEEVLDWEDEVRARSECRIFCGRTQFLGMAEYEKVFRDVGSVGV